MGLEAVELPRLNQFGLGFNLDQSPELDLESLLQLTQASQLYCVLTLLSCPGSCFVHNLAG